eukprot:UN1891
MYALTTEWSEPKQLTLRPASPSLCKRGVTGQSLPVRPENYKVVQVFVYCVASLGPVVCDVRQHVQLSSRRMAESPLKDDDGRTEAREIHKRAQDLGVVALGIYHEVVHAADLHAHLLEQGRGSVALHWNFLDPVFQVILVAELQWPTVEHGVPSPSVEEDVLAAQGRPLASALHHPARRCLSDSQGP